ncbi:MAG: methionine--tRNA ligase [Bacteroidetes bacterium]|nr:MAG: methionine--tRNA ligase [Bacteroidota bacterium]
MTKQRYTVTAALPYANGPLHLGHVAGVYLPADILVRFLRLKGEDVLFVCGSDEHGAAITLRAKKEGISPKEIVDKYNHLIADSFEKFGISFDIFDRTSSPEHHQTAQDFFLELYRKKKFIEKESEQYYDPEFKQFLADRYITGECPKCANPNAYGDQCERCGSDLSPLELKNPLSTLSGKTPELRKTSHWYLPMDQHEAWLKEWIQDGKLDGEQQHDPKEWKNQVIGQCMSWINAGLRPRAMTRDLEWGVPVPLEQADGKVLYVWLDAPIGYISASKKWAEKNGKDWKKYWLKQNDPAETSKLIHFIGKDNIVFHAIIFPILLKDHGDFILPDNVPAYEFLNLEGDKFSTSRNWAVWLNEYLERHPDKIDELKYTLTAIAPETKDSEFTWKEFQARVNNELADILGNFINRVLVLSKKYYQGIVPTPGELSPEDLELQKSLSQFPDRIEKLIRSYKIREAQSEVMNMARLGNKYLADMEPWKLIKTDPERVQTIMYQAIQIAAKLGVSLQVFLPETAKKINAFLLQEDHSWDRLKENDLLKPGHELGQAEILFQKVEDQLVEQERELLEESRKTGQTTREYAAEKNRIQWDDFTKLDMRTGTILSAEKVKGADKLLKLEVDTGLDKRTIVSGIAEHFSPEEIIGKTVAVLLNLEPRKIRGVESQGMILMAENGDGRLSFLSPDSDTETGAEIR